MIRQPGQLIESLTAIHAAMRDRILRQAECSELEEMAAVADDSCCDTIFAIDRVSEEALLDLFSTLARERSMVLVAEGLGETGETVLPHGTRREDAELYVIVDPIDGTRGIMYQKRPAWILTGIAPNTAPRPGLRDIEIAVQTEIPLLKQHLCDTLWAIKDGGAHGRRINRLDGTAKPISPQPSTARTIAQGFGGLARFFPGGRDILAAIDDDVVERIMGPVIPGKAHCFEDQYISTGGQLYELIMGRDRWMADLRPLAATLLEKRGSPLGLCCHPYDLCTELIAREAGVIVTDEAGGPLAAPLDTMTDCSWIGYANTHLRALIEPALQAAMRQAGMAPR